MKKLVLIAGFMILFLTNNLLTEQIMPECYIKSAAYMEAEPYNEEMLLFNDDETVAIDIGSTSRGIVRVRYTGENPLVKVIISKDDESSYPYWVSRPGEFEDFSLVFGNGEYQISIYEWSHDNYYSTAFTQEMTVVLDDEDLPFLYANFFVDYSEEDTVVQLAESFYQQANSREDLVLAVYDYVRGYSYDYDKNANVTSRDVLYKTELGEIYNQQTGICMDYAIVMAAMLRSQGIPTKVEFGYVGDAYHAWVNVHLSNGDWQIYDPTFGSSLGLNEVNKLINQPENYIPLYIN